MKNRRLIVLGILGLVLAVGLTGCIVSASPDTSKTLIMKPGEPLEFKVVAVPQGICTWELDGVTLSETDSTFVYAPTTADLGWHRLWVCTSNMCRSWDISVEIGPPVTWERTWGVSYYDSIYSIVQTSDGGYIIAGTFSNIIINGNTGYIAKLDASGKLEWQKMYDDNTYSIQQTSDGGYIAAGEKFKNDGFGGNVFSITKLDTSGTITWQKTFSGESVLANDSKAMSIQQTADGGYIAAGYSNSRNIPGVTNHGGNDYYVIKLDAIGNVEWQHMYGGSSYYDFARSIQQASDGGYIVAGYSDSQDIEGVIGQGHYYIVKLDASGGVVWQRLYDTQSDDTGASSIQQTSDGGYVVVGSQEQHTNDFPYSYDHGCYVLKLDASGNVIWQKSYGGYSGNSIQQTTDGGYIVVGSGSDYVYAGPGYEVSLGHLFKLDSDGNKEWERQYRKNYGMKLFAVRQTMDSGYVAAGSCDQGTKSFVWGLWPDPQSGGSRWGWLDLSTWNENCYVLKVGPDGEIQ